MRGMGAISKATPFRTGVARTGVTPVPAFRSSTSSGVGVITTIPVDTQVTPVVTTKAKPCGGFWPASPAGTEAASSMATFVEKNENLHEASPRTVLQELRHLPELNKHA